MTTLAMNTDGERDLSCAHGGGNSNFEFSNSQNLNHLIDWSTGTMIDVNYCDQTVLNVWASRFCPAHQRHIQYEVYPSAPAFQPKEVSHSGVVEAEVYN